MITYKKALLAAVTSLVLVTMTGCGAVTEKWAYSHEPEKEIIALSDNGKAEYKGEKYTYTKDENFISLKDKSGEEEKLRYVMNGDRMTLYEKSTYYFDGKKDTEGIVGDWKQDNGWSYEFTGDGKFSEENIFFGRYTIDEDNNCIRLMYDDPIEDAYLYYTLDGDRLTIDYPWPMVKMGS